MRGRSVRARGATSPRRLPVIHCVILATVRRIHMRSFRRMSCCSWMLVLVLGLSGCAMVSPKPSQSEYLVVDYRRFVSGVYVDGLANKYVRVTCQFSSIMAGTLPGGYSTAGHMSFLAVSPTGYGIESPERLTIVVPKDIADIVFTLRHGDQIQVSGLAVPVFSRRRFGDSVFKSLILEADLIQKQ